MRFMTTVLFFILTSVACAQPKLVTSGRPSLIQGVPATVSISLAGGGVNPAALQISVTVPAGAAIVQGDGLAAAGKKLYQNTINGVALLLVAWDGVAPAGGAGLIPDGELATIVFTSAPFNFVLSGPLAASPTASAIVLTAPSNFNFGSPCDLNSDGITDILDLRNVIDQIDKVSACTTGDINGDGKCDVFDAQRLVNALTGGGCVTGR